MRWYDLIIPILAGLLVLIIGELVVDIGIIALLKAIGIALVCAVVGGGAGAASGLFLFKKHVRGDLDAVAAQALFAVNEIRTAVSTAVEEVKESEERISKALHSIIASRMITDDYMAHLEKHCACKDIWIVTPDLHKDIETPDSGLQFFDVVSDNIMKKKVKYTYLVPDEHTVVMRARILLTKYKTKERPEIYALRPDIWKTLPYTAGDYIIYNPTLASSGDLTEGFVEVPSKTRDLWVKLSEPTLHEWMRRMEQIIADMRTNSKPVEALKGSA